MDSEWSADRESARDSLVTPHVGRGPAVPVLHSGRGLTEFVTTVCQRLARDGFVALAPALFDGETPTSRRSQAYSPHSGQTAPQSSQCRSESQKVAPQPRQFRRAAGGRASSPIVRRRKAAGTV